MRILALGLGNDLHGDDGVGLRAVRLLRSRWLRGMERRTTPAEVDFAECFLTGVALLDVLCGYEAAVIIDTILKPRPVTGRIRILDVSRIRDFPGPSPHFISIPQTLTLGRWLGLAMPAAVKVVAVEARDLFELGEGLSRRMRSRLPAILDAAYGVLLRLALGNRPPGLSRPAVDVLRRTG